MAPCDGFESIIREIIENVYGQTEAKGISYDSLLDRQLARLSGLKENRNLTAEELQELAYDETIAEMSETMLTDTDAAQRVSQELYKKDRTLWEKIKDFFTGLVEKLKNAYKGVDPDSDIGRVMKRAISDNEKVAQAWAEAVVEAGENYQLQDGTVIGTDGNSADYLYSNRVTDKKTLDFLDGQETVTTYKTMQLVDGKLYPPMAAVVAGSYEDYSELGKWEAATEHPELIKLDKSGKPKFTLNKGKGQGSLAAAYNPYMHSSNLVLNDQFSGAYTRPNLVTVECRVPVSELTSGYKAQYAKDSVGWHSWHTGTVAGALRQQTGTERQVLLSRWIMPVRIVPNAEVAQMYKQLLDGTDIAVPDNVVPPALLTELKKAGVAISESGRIQDGQKNNARAGERYSLRGYTDQQKKNWESSKRIVIYDNQEQLSQFISDSIADKTMDKKMYFGAIPADLASRIKSDTGVNVENFNLSLGSYEVRKILKDHGNAAKEAARGQRAIVADDFGHITDIVLNPTEITLSNQDYMGKPAIIFSGDHNGRMNVVAVVSDKRLDLFVQTVYTNVKKGNLATPTGEQAPINTPEANSSTVSDNSIRKSSRNVNSVSENQTETENFKKWFGNWQNDPAKASKVVNEDGTPKVLYHQTAEDFTIFEPRHQGAGTRDSDTPFGIFMKSSDKNIGVNGEKQMALYAKIVNPLTVIDRADLISQLKKISPEYVKAADELRELNAAYQKKHDNATKAFRDYILEWRKAHPDASRTALYDDAGFNEVYEAEDNILDEWESEARKVELRSKEAITRDLENHGYDGVIIQFDKGSFGRSTDAYIALHPEQVKSATDNIGTFDKANPDIRYSNRNSGESQVDRLARKNEELKAEAEYLKQVVQIQKRGNSKNLRDRESVNAIAKGILESVNAKDSEFGKKLNDFYRDMVTVEMDYDTMREKAGELADRALEHHQAERDGYAQEVLDFLKKRRVSLTESQIGDAEYTYGSLSEFKKAIKGSIIIDQNSTTSLDQLWQEAAAQFPDRFSAETVEADIGNYISADRTDTKTFIPFLKKLCNIHPVRRVVVDSGYESEENYNYVDGLSIVSICKSESAKIFLT